MATYELTEKQYSELMKRLNPKGKSVYEVYNDLIARKDTGGSYSNDYITAIGGGFRAVATGGHGALAVMKVYEGNALIPPGSPFYTRPRRELTTEDPAITAELRRMGIKPGITVSDREVSGIFKSKDFMKIGIDPKIRIMLGPDGDAIQKAFDDLFKSMKKLTLTQKIEREKPPFAGGTKGRMDQLERSLADLERRAATLKNDFSGLRNEAAQLVKDTQALENKGKKALAKI
jgi:hypothetical protein